jgi:thymidylate synthase (FAD)
MPINASRVDEVRWTKFPMLDDGFACLVDVMGNQSVVQAARVSYGEGTYKVSLDSERGGFQFRRVLFSAQQA